MNKQFLLIILFIVLLLINIIYNAIHVTLSTKDDVYLRLRTSLDLYSQQFDSQPSFSSSLPLTSDINSHGNSANSSMAASSSDEPKSAAKSTKPDNKYKKKKKEIEIGYHINITNDYSTEKMIKKKDERRRDGREYLIHKELIKHEKLGIEYSQGLNTNEIGPICSDKVGMKKYRCDSPNEYCDRPKCSHSSVYQLVPGKSEVTTTDFTHFFDHINHYFNGMEERLVHVSQLLDEYHKEAGIEKFSRPMFLMFVNFGYIYQFINWLCSCEKNGIENIKKEIIVLTTDDLAQNVLKTLGIYTINVKDSGAWMRNTKYEAHASKKFGLGVHAKINTQSIALLTDMIQLGYNVFVMDADLVWKKDPRPEMIKLAEEKDYDGLFISDGRRWDYSYDNFRIMPQFRLPPDFDHPYLTHNTGFFLIRSSPSMKEFTASLMRGLHLILWKGTDQMWWNTLIFHRKFSHLKFGVMPTKTYIPGSNISTSGVLKYPKEPFPKDNFMVAHMSDTNSHLKKITKFYLTGQWYLTEECPFFQVCIDAKETKESVMGCLPDNYKDYFNKDMVVPAGRL